MLVAEIAKYIHLDVWYRICFISQRIRDVANRDHDSREIRECNHLLMLVMLLPRDQYDKWNKSLIIRNQTLKWSHLVMLNYFRDSGSGIPDQYDPNDMYFECMFIRGSLEEIERWIPRLRSYIIDNPQKAYIIRYDISCNIGMTIKFIRAYPDMIDYRIVTGNENIPMREIASNMDIAWDWQYISWRSDIDWNFVMQHSEFNWDWEELSMCVPISTVLDNPQMPWSIDGLSDNNNLAHRSAIKLSITNSTHLFACIPIEVLKAEGLYDIDKTGHDYWQINPEKLESMISKYPDAEWKWYRKYRMMGASSVAEFNNNPKYVNYRKIKSYHDVIDNPNLPWSKHILSRMLTELH